MASRVRSSNTHLWKLVLGGLGVVYGDIGTSPLYAMKESFHPIHGILYTPDNVLGILSLIFWSLTLVVTIKYIGFVLRADNQGEGGVTALLALLLPTFRSPNDKLKPMVIFLALFGAGLLYGDGLITPAISVLSAVEGLQVATEAHQPYVVPITVFILIALFTFQRFGTEKIGAIFGPTILLWFVTIACIGAPWIFHRPEILKALNPYYVIQFFINNGRQGFFILSAIILCVTGGEALYADMGHFGKKAIRISWYSIVYPCLIINYFGQGALVLDQGESVLKNTFFSMVSGYWIYPLVVIATLAAIVASQALISGAYSLTQQVIQLGFLPRTAISHTSSAREGQIYMPSVNLFLMIGCVFLVVQFASSSNLAAAYGIAVTGTMTITSILLMIVSIKIWKWKPLATWSLFSVFLIIDLCFFTANFSKLMQGGWFPLLVAIFLYLTMDSWRKGRAEVSKRMVEIAMPLDAFFKELEQKNPPRVKGTAIFMSLNQDIAPSVLIHHFTHNKVLHEQVILLSILTEHRPEVSTVEHARRTDLQHGFYKVVARFGYMQVPAVMDILQKCHQDGLDIDFENLSFYLGREIFLTTGKSRMKTWQKKWFVYLSRNARSAAEFFRLPPNKVIEIGSQIEI